MIRTHQLSVSILRQGLEQLGVDGGHGHEEVDLAPGQEVPHRRGAEAGQHAHRGPHTDRNT